MILDPLTILDVKKRIGKLVKLMRKKEGLTQDALAVKLSMSRITVQNLESGKNATLDTLLKVMQYVDLMDNLNTFIEDQTLNNSYESLY
jgi:transcriptional regulator with XRE-family HTH domain